MKGGWLSKPGLAVADIHHHITIELPPPTLIFSVRSKHCVFPLFIWTLWRFDSPFLLLRTPSLDAQHSSWFWFC